MKDVPRIAPEVSDINIGFAYRGPSWNLSAKTLDTFGSVRISQHLKYDSETVSNVIFISFNCY